MVKSLRVSKLHLCGVNVHTLSPYSYTASVMLTYSYQKTGSRVRAVD
jgi:hypothetical protein